MMLYEREKHRSERERQRKKFGENLTRKKKKNRNLIEGYGSELYSLIVSGTDPIVDEASRTRRKEKREI